jgi:hypothetical protein
MKIKPGTKPSIRLEMIKVRKAVEQTFNAYGYDCWLTSGMDGTHGTGSLHYAGYAEDYDASVKIPTETWQRIEMDVTQSLGGLPYQVIAHAGHLHVEYDPIEFQRYK